MKKIISLLIFFYLLLLISCSSTKKDLVSSNQKVLEFFDDYGQKSLILEPDGKYLYRYTDEYLKYLKFYLIQDLCYGTWRFENGFYILNSAEEIQNPILDRYVEEMEIENDSVKIEIVNPYEEYIKENHIYMHFEYDDDKLIKKFQQVRFFEYEVAFDAYRSSKTRIFRSDKADFQIEKDSLGEFRSISISIIPYLSYPGNITFKSLGTNSYRIQNSQSNFFRVHIPQFTMEYLGYIRFKEEYVKVIDKNTVQLRGEKFKKK